MKRQMTLMLCAPLALVLAFASNTPDVLAAQPTIFPIYAITDLGTFGGTSSSALDINAAGQIVGGAYTASNFLHPFL